MLYHIAEYTNKMLLYWRLVTNPWLVLASLDFLVESLYLSKRFPVPSFL